jgi:hypothetical protein
MRAPHAVAAGDTACARTGASTSSGLFPLRRYGYFFGYPDYAVDFFVTAAAPGTSRTTIQPTC